MNENILYVTPNGIAIDKDGFERFKETAIEVWEKVKDIFQEIKRLVRGLMDQLLDHKEVNKCTKQSWYVPKSTVKYSQVMNRKPMVSHIRNNI